MGYIFYDSYKHRELLHGMKKIPHEIPGATMTKEKIHTGIIEHRFNFYSFRREPPRKMTSTLILGLAIIFEGVPSEDPSARATPKLSYSIYYF